MPMIASRAELFAVLRQFNPWWRGRRFPDLPDWHRAALRQILAWADEPPGGRALLLSGARQVGKTTLFLQAIDHLLEHDVPPANVLYATFDHPLLKLAGLEAVMRLWREYEPAQPGAEFLFLDEIQMTKDWQTWIKHQVDFAKGRRVAVTGSATPLVREGQESGVGRWQTIRLATLSFYEYLQLNKLQIPELPEGRSLREMFGWSPPQLAQLAEDARPLTAHFHEYLLRGGFPQTALKRSIPEAQKLMREDIVDKVLKRDMTALFGVRRILELEQLFLYLCLHDGGQLDVAELCSALEMKRPTVNSFLDLLEATHLVYRLRPFGYGKQVLRGRPKFYLADAAIAPGVMLKGKSLLEDAPALGRAVETAFFKHVFTRYYTQSIGFSYWRGKHGHEVDIIADVEGELVPFEIKYRERTHTGTAELKGIVEFCQARGVERGYVITRDPTDFSVHDVDHDAGRTRLLTIPAPLACFWLGRSELSGPAVDSA